MSTTPTSRPAADAPVPRSIGPHGSTLVLATMAGGILVGGVLVAAMTLGGRLSAHALFLNATGLFLVGALLGFLHGAVLAALGRPHGIPLRRAVRDLGLATAYAVPAVAVAWLVAVWMALTLVAIYAGRLAPLAGVAAAWVAGGVVISAAAVQAWRSLARAYGRWPERRAGTLVVAASFAAMLLLFLADRPEVWGIGLRVTPTGAVLLAMLLSIWVVGPAVTVALRLARRLPFARPLAGLRDVRHLGVDIGVGLAVGAALGLLAVPFAAPTPREAGAAAVITVVGQALVDQVLLRLVVLTSAAWLLLRWARLRPATAMAGAVGLAAAVQVILYAPGALAVGFPTASMTLAFLVGAVAVPALVYGLLFWRRSFSAALAANAAALLVLLLA